MAEENRNQTSLEDLERLYRELSQLSLSLITQISDISNSLPLIVLLFVDVGSITFNSFDNDIKMWIKERIYIIISILTLYVLLSIILYLKCYKPFAILLNVDSIKAFTMVYKLFRVSIVFHPIYYLSTALITIYSNTLYISVYLLYFSSFYFCLFIYCVLISTKKRVNSNYRNNNCYKCMVIIPIILAFSITVIFMGEMSQLNYAFYTTTERGTVIAITFINSMILFYLYVGFEAENSSLVMCLSNELLIYLAPIIYTLFILYTTYSIVRDCLPSSVQHNIVDEEEDFYFDDIMFDEDADNNNLEEPLLQNENEDN